MNAKAVVGWLAVALVIAWVVLDAQDAARLVHNVGMFLSSAASGITDFFVKI